jgi:hypothetical protein
MDIRKHAVPETAVFHLHDAGEELLYADDERTKPMRVHLYSPGSKQFAKAQSDRNNRILHRMKAKGKADLTPEEQTKEKATYLADCTHSWENLDYEGKQGRDLSMAVYSDQTIGFIADQNAQRLGDWKNFTKDSQTS